MGILRVDHTCIMTGFLTEILFYPILFFTVPKQNSFNHILYIIISKIFRRRSYPITANGKSTLFIQTVMSGIHKPECNSRFCRTDTCNILQITRPFQGNIIRWLKISAGISRISYISCFTCFFSNFIDLSKCFLRLCKIGSIYTNQCTSFRCLCHICFQYCLCFRSCHIRRYNKRKYQQSGKNPLLNCFLFHFHHSIHMY